MARRKKVIRFPGINEVSIPQLLQSMEIIIMLLAKRGIDIRDWDDKTKVLRQVRIIGGKVYFFAEKEDKA